MTPGVKAGVTLTGLAAVMLLGAACAAAKPEAQAKPKTPPPTVPGVRSAPPPAWIETRRGDRWLAFSSYCWTVTCIDSRPLEDRADIPRIVVTRGETVRFHLGFEPTKLSVKVGSVTYPLKAARVASWRARGTGKFSVVHATKGGFRAEYAARLVFS
jgi:hypothetical protein